MGGEVLLAAGADAVADDEEFGEFGAGDDGREAEDAGGCQGDEGDENAAGHQQVLGEHSPGGAGVGNRVGQAAQVFAHEGDIGRFDADIAAHGAHRDAAVGGSQGGRVVDAVADHRHGPAHLEFGDDAGLALGEESGAHVVDAGGGPSGVGKSTTIQALRAALDDCGVLVRQTVEPTTSGLGRFISGHFSHIRGRALACLVAADRYEHVEHDIEPWLRAGETVITDRYLASTLVMQQLDGVPLKFLLDLNAHVLMPDLAVILTADPALIAERIAARGPHNRFHFDPTAPGREVVLYEEAAQTLEVAGVKILVVNTGEATPTEVAAAIVDAVPDSSVASAVSTPPTTSQGL